MENDKTPPKRKAWRPKEVASMLGLSISQIRNDIRRGKIKIVKIGRAILILDDDLNDYFRQSCDGSSR